MDTILTVYRVGGDFISQIFLIILVTFIVLAVTARITKNQNIKSWKFYKVVRHIATFRWIDNS